MYKWLYDCFSHWYNKNGGVILFYSDPHFNEEEMKYLRKNYIGDEEQIKRINKVVGKNDTIIFLGDIGNTDWIKKVRGYKVLIMGNHDSGASNYKRDIHEEYIDFTFTDEEKEELDKIQKRWLPYDGPGDFAACQSELNNVKKKYAINRVRENYSKDYTFDRLSYNDYEDTWKIVLRYDNHLFDEVYDGPLFINDKILLSHEPVNLPYIFNIHGHDHSNCENVSEHHLNVCAEWIDYTPVRFTDIIKSGELNKVDNIHRQTIDVATIRKCKRNTKL